VGVDNDGDGQEGVQYLGWGNEGSWDDSQKSGGHSALYGPQQGVTRSGGSHTRCTYGDLTSNGLKKQERIDNSSGIPELPIPSTHRCNLGQSQGLDHRLALGISHQGGVALQGRNAGRLNKICG